MELKALYSLSEYAEMLGESLDAVRHWADRGHLPTVIIGRKRYVTLAYLQGDMPDVFASICLKLQIEAASKPRAMVAGRGR